MDQCKPHAEDNGRCEASGETRIFDPRLPAASSLERRMNIYLMHETN